MNVMSAVLVAAVLVVGSGCTKPDWIERTLVTVDVTGTWSGTSTKGPEYQFVLEQSGPGVKGSATRRSAGIVGGTGGSGFVFWSGTVEGTVSGDVFTFRGTSSIGSVSGELKVNDDELSGQISDGLGVSHVTLKRVGARPSSNAPKP